MSFDPHLGDFLMIGVTVASAVTMAILAYLAHSNGKEATSIAKKATEIAAESAEISRKAEERNEAHIESESIRRDAEAQAEIALAMSRSINSLDYALQLHHGNVSGYTEREKSEAALLTNSLTLEAYARIDLRVWVENGSLLREWYSQALLGMREMAPSGMEEGSKYDELHTKIVKKIALWNSNALPADRLHEDLH